jgi:hypothetical protein
VSVLTVSASFSPMRRLYPFTSALRIAVSLRLKDSGGIRSLPKWKSLQRGSKAPWRLHFPTLRVACSHGHLRKVKVMLKVDRKTELSEIRKRIDVFRRDVQIFYLLDLTSD